MKNFLFALTALFSVSIGLAQAPANYYNSATGTGYQLKNQLYSIIKDHDDQSYAALWNLYKHDAFRDVYDYYEDDGTLLDMYSENPSSTDPYNFYTGTNQCGNYSGEGSCYNREHTIPQSVFGSGGVPKTDGHHVVPTDGYVNNKRSNFPFGNTVSNGGWTSLNGSRVASSAVPGYTGNVFEPIDEFKGDFARIHFYFATRYQNQISSWNYAMFNGTSNQVFEDGFLDVLLQWHENDPVSEVEIARNNRVYQFQDNRNPFIDNPAYVHEIWGYSSTYSVADLEQIYVSVYPNPAKDQRINISTDKQIEKITLINLNGQIIQQIKQPVSQNNTYTLENLPQGFYLLNLNVENQNITKKVIVN